MTYYDSIAEGYDELHGEEQRRKLEFVAAELGLEGERVLDVGCGSGLSFEFFENIKGIDPSKKLAEKAGERAIIGKGENLPFEDNQFDVVICITALHNFDDPKKGLEEMSRVSRNKVVVSLLKKASSHDSLADLVREKLDVYKEENDEHDTIFFSRKGLNTAEGSGRT